MNNEFDVYQAFITIYEGADWHDSFAANSTLDTFQVENPLHPLSDTIDHFIEAMYGNDYRTVQRIVEDAYDYVLWHP